MLTLAELRPKFNNYFPKIVQKILYNVEQNNKKSSSLTNTLNKMQSMLDYNVPCGKQTRGLTVVSSFMKLSKDKMTEDLEDRVMTLGWAVEVLQASFLVADDVMDQSDMRRGQKCWYKLPEVGLSAVNDSLILESCVFTLLKLACKKEPCYVDLIELFHEIITNTTLGQSMDMATTENPIKGDFSLFTEDHYFNLITYKTGYYSFYLPVAASMYLAGLNCSIMHKTVSDILLKIGQLFQIQDDYLDCFGDPKVTGKIGTDIEDNKCSWLIIQALKKANKDQLSVLTECYGRKEKVLEVQMIYSQLELENEFRSTEEKMYNEIVNQIENSHLGKSFPNLIYFELLQKIYKREK